MSLDDWRDQRVPQNVYESLWVSSYEGFLSLPRRNRLDRILGTTTVLDVHLDGSVINPNAAYPFWAAPAVPPIEERSRNVGHLDACEIEALDRFGLKPDRAAVRAFLTAELRRLQS